MDSTLPEWAHQLAGLLPPRARLRPRDGGVMLRIDRQTARVRPASRQELALRACLPGLFGRCVGVLPSADGFFLIDGADHGHRLDRAGSEPRYLQLAMTVWALHCAGHTPDDIEMQRMLATDGGLKFLALPAAGSEPRAATALAWARAFITGRRATAGLRADRLAPLVQRVLGGESAAAAMLRAKLGMLPDVEAWRAAMRSCLHQAMGAVIPQIVVVSDSEQGAAAHALLCEAALEAGVAAGDGPAFGGSLRLIGPLNATDCECRLGRLSASPTVAIVTGAPLDVARELEHVASFSPPVQVSGRGVFEWLRPLGAQASLAVEELVPALERDPMRARQTVCALIERAGAVFDDDGPRLDPGWVEHWQAIRGRRNALSVLEPDAVRVANMLAVSPGGLSAQGVASSNELKRGAAMLEDIGLAVRVGDALVASEGSRAQPAERATRRALLLWLSERHYLAPESDTALRDAWRIGLRLRAGDLACWHDEAAEKLLERLIVKRAYPQALQLIESHAAGSVSGGVGPPSIDVLYAARDMGMALWKPRRLRRLLRMWQRGYHGEWRALTLAIQAHVERQLGGVDAYAPLIAECEKLCADLGRFPSEQAQIEAAHCCSYDDPAQAMRLLQGVSANPARSARYLCEARVLRIRAECEFVRIHLEQSYTLVQQARDKLGHRAPNLMRARIEADIEARHMMNHSMLTFYKADAKALLEPLQALQANPGCVDDILRSAIVNDSLMRMRTWEVGLATPEEMNGVLAEARPYNLRGYLVVLFQLSENATHRGDCELANQLSARIGALNPSGDGNQTVHSGWKRHNAINAALGGDWPKALANFRDSRSWHIAEPWGTRTKILRRGEWGLLLLLAGKWAKAARAFQYAFESLVAMSAGARASVHLIGGMLCNMMLGRAHSAAQTKDFDDFVAQGYVLPQVIRPLMDAIANPQAWAGVAERIDEIAAPEFWKAIALAFAAVLARRARSPSADQLARASREKLQPDWVILRDWLDSQSPAPARVGALTPAALGAILEMQLPQQPTPRALAELACAAISRASGAAAAAQIGLEPAVSSGDLTLVLERALMGEVVDETESCAIALAAPFGAIAVRQSGALPLLQAVARRLSELAELAQARNTQRSRRRQGRDAVRAAWALTTGDPSPGARLQALRALLIAETGADDAALALVRGTHEVLAAGGVPRWSAESAGQVDAVLHLRARIAGGDALLLDESTARAARALALVLQQAPERLRLELGRSGEDEAAIVAGENLGSSPASRRLLEDLRRFADIDLPITVIGEPGSGKDLALKALHSLSGRSARPHVVIDCPTLRRETAASELFGHVRGAFTGATGDHMGMLERAAEGLLQLDGIASLDLSIQAMLLRAFQARSFLPVGGVVERRLKARIAVTSDRPLDQLVQQGLLREDLSQRLQGVQLVVPPLRERGDDALTFAREALQRLARQFNRRLRFTKAAESYIREHHWPGNVRELKSAAMRAAVMAAGPEVGMADLLSPEIGAVQSGFVLPADSKDMNTSARLVLGTLRQLGKAPPLVLVRRLGLSRTTVSTCLSELARGGLCERIGKGRATHYRAL